MIAYVRIRFVIFAVRAVSLCWDQSFGAFVMYGRRSKRSRFWAWYAIRLERVLFPIARRCDYPNENWMGAEMAEHAWWG